MAEGVHILIVNPGGCAQISSMPGGVATAAASDAAESARSEHWDSKIEAAGASAVVAFRPGSGLGSVVGQ